MPKRCACSLIGDVVGPPGCRALFMGLPTWCSRLGADLVSPTAENAADGLGPDPRDRRLACSRAAWTSSPRATTSGSSREILPMLDTDERSCCGRKTTRVGVPGNGHCVVTVQRTRPWRCSTSQGRVSTLAHCADPFAVGRRRSARAAAGEARIMPRRLPRRERRGEGGARRVASTARRPPWSARTPTCRPPTSGSCPGARPTSPTSA